MDILIFLGLSILSTVAENYVIDISKELDPKIGSRVDYGEGEESYSIISPKEGVYITCVRSGDSLIWTGGVYEWLGAFRINYLYGVALAATLRVESGGKTSHIYYKIKSNEYEKITREEHEKIMEKISTNRRLNIKNINHMVFKSEPFEERPSTATIYGPRKKYRMIAVQDNDIVLWEARVETASCDYVVLHGDQDNPEFIHMFTRNNGMFEMVYFTKRDGQWASISEDVFNAELGPSEEFMDTKL